jgi:uncharacterized protein YjbI with pentapeptide repeats
MFARMTTVRGEVVLKGSVDGGGAAANAANAAISGDSDGASLDGASLDGASLDGASLDGASLDGTSLDGASLDGVVWKEYGWKFKASGINSRPGIVQPGHMPRLDWKLCNKRMPEGLMYGALDSNCVLEDELFYMSLCLCSHLGLSTEQ